MERQNLRTQVNEVDYEQPPAPSTGRYDGFAYSLSGNENDACELTQETFARLLSKSAQVREESKLKSWLFTTLYRVFLGWKSRERRLPHFEISSVEHELPPVAAELVDMMERDTVRDALLKIDERYRVPLMLYYLEEHSYEEIAELLEIPIGTVMSRLSRAKVLMRQCLAARSIGEQRTIVPLNPASNSTNSSYE